jgi:hypothetical protein
MARNSETFSAVHFILEGVKPAVKLQILAWSGFLSAWFALEVAEAVRYFSA